MRILFVTGLYPKESILEIKEYTFDNLQNAPNVFQWAVVDGLHKNKVKFDVVSLPFLPAYPKRAKKLFSPSGDILLDDEKVGDMLSYCNLMGFKEISILHTLKRYVKKWIKANINDELFIITYTPYVPFIKALKALTKKYTQVKIASIVTDLVDDVMNFSSNTSFLKKVQLTIQYYQTKKLYKDIDKFILLSKYMVEKIPEAKGKNIVVEGVAKGVFNLKTKRNCSIEKKLLYTGTIEEFAGVKILVDSFLLTQDHNYRLVLCGYGDENLIDYIKQMSQKDSRIQFLGRVDREEAVRLQREATVLINPRQPNGAITKYSFPSKTMEYMTSGTPMIGYKLEGIPEEYYDNMYTIEDNKIETLAKCIDEVLSLSQTDLNEKARKAFEFIKNNKTSQMQVRKIIDFLEI